MSENKTKADDLDPSSKRDSSASESERAERTDFSRMFVVAKGLFGRILVSAAAVEGIALAFKQTLNPNHLNELKSEFDVYRAIEKPLSSSLFKVPKPLKFYPDVPALLTRYEVVIDDQGPIFSMRSVPNVSLDVRNVIRDNFVAERARSKFVGLRLCRIYLGVDNSEFIAKRQRSVFFNTTNYLLCSKDIEFLRQQGVIPPEFTCAAIATGMGETLAVFHHELKYDARDIEFVLSGGSEPEELADLWVLDFNQVKTWKSVDDMVSAFVDNDPYCPRPGSEFWNAFVAGYLAKSKSAPNAVAFIQALVDKAKAVSSNVQK